MAFCHNFAPTKTNKSSVGADRKCRTNASLQSVYASACKEWRLSLRINEKSVNFTPTRGSALIA